MHRLPGLGNADLQNSTPGVKDGQDHDEANWQDKRVAEQNFKDGREPVVLIIGAGQGGLSLAARLKQLGVPALVIDQNRRIGDNWRNRYHQLVLHDSVWSASLIWHDGIR